MFYELEFVGETKHVSILQQIMQKDICGRILKKAAEQENIHENLYNNLAKNPIDE